MTSTFTFDKKMDRMIKELEKKFNLDSEEAVLKRALFVLDAIGKYKSNDGSITIMSEERNQEPIKLIVSDAK